MIETYDENGIHFQYPANWLVDREETDTGWTITVQSPDTAFLMICLREDLPTTDELADTALAALREDYTELEADECAETFAGHAAYGHDIRFFSLDLTNTCWTRSFYTTRGTVLVMGQYNDLEFEKNEPVLRAICASLKVDDE
jgi:hypothetical protein